ncbi:hypothetical protein [Brucella intermedia]|uniref:hypothetical protein n=1 Tax=Brucella intermedia TaxID=94625 RepID=UPI0007C6B846|nr:hypothetical protein [Brucella intermedia]OAE39597.1 hypothetical protein A7J42_13875 [Brucella intermedia]
MPYIFPGWDEDDEMYKDAVDEKGVLKQGKALRISVLCKDSATGAANRVFVNDSQSMSDAARACNDALERSIRDLNAWRDNAENPPSSQQVQPVITADALSQDAAYQRSVDDLNAWRYR